MVAMEALMLSCTIVSKEQWEVATAEILRTFIQADMICNVQVKHEGKIA